MNESINSMLAGQVDRMNEQYRAVSKSIEEARDAHTSKGVFERLKTQVEQFQAGLDQSHEVGVLLASFGQQSVLSIDRIGFVYPSLITFDGVDEEGQSVRLVQHIGQLNFLMIRRPLTDPTKPRRSIGFTADI